MSKEHSHAIFNRDSDNKTTVDLSIEPVNYDTNIPANTSKSDPEADITLSHSILKNGQQVRITWTAEEEALIVRKLDILFLPIFAVSQRTPLPYPC